MIYLSDSELRGLNIYSETVTMSFSSNFGSLVAFNSYITFIGYARFVNNQPPQAITGDFQEGGAITLFQSKVFFNGSCSLEHNHAENGGAILSTESKLYVYGNVIIAHNTATRNGGGVYLSSTSELNCHQKSTFILFSNTAIHKGGGLHAISSSIKATSTFAGPYTPMPGYTGTRINFTRNLARIGGGLSLDANANFYILKYDWISIHDSHDTNTTIFTANKADYGGAVYVDDDTDSGTCISDLKTECFLQVLASNNFIFSNKYLKTQSIYFSQNHANISGSTLYGGLLDRCAVSQFAEVHNKYKFFQNYEYNYNGISYFKDISTGDSSFISSLPVQVCLCISNQHNCTR